MNLICQHIRWEMYRSSKTSDRERTEGNFVERSGQDRTVGLVQTGDETSRVGSGTDARPNQYWQTGTRLKCCISACDK